MKAIAILLKKNEQIEEIRNKYLKDNTKPHITLVYPFEEFESIDNHVKESIKEIKPFRIILKSLQKSAKENYLYLLVDEGKRQIKKLYDKLHTRELSNHKNPDMPKYIPHLSIGRFDNEEELLRVKNKLQEKKIKHKEIVSSIHLLTLENNQLKKSEKFNLNT